MMEGLVPPPIGHDFMFSESELSDILEFMQRSDGVDGAGPNSAGAPPFFGSTPTSMALSMQFLPHAPEDAHLGVSLPLQSPALSYSSDEVFVKAEGDARGALVGAANGSSSQLYPPPAPLASAQARGGPATRSAAAHEPAGGGFAERPHTGVKKEPKTHVSHSTVEKQRRDRINSLIDELRDLVPPQSHNSTVQDAQDSKRPKHVVLSDTIALVRELQSKATLSDAPAPMMKTSSLLSGGSVHSGDAQDLLRRSLSEPPGPGDSPPKPNSPPELPSAPHQVPVEPGVVVDLGDGCMYVKISCQDRRGLLSDLIIALKQMPLEITTAAITTRQDGNVYNVFQVKTDDAALAPQDVQGHVSAILATGAGSHLGDKRRRPALLPPRP